MSVDHLLFTPEQVSRSMLAALRNRSTLARLVNQDFSRDFVPGRGASVTVKSPVRIDPAKVYTGENRKNEDAIKYSHLFEPYTSIKLKDQIYNAVKLPDHFVTFTLADMERQVVAPMAESVADALNELVAAAFKTAPAGLSTADTAEKGHLVDKEGKTAATVAEARESGLFPVAIGVGLKKNGSVKDADLTANNHAQVLPAIRAAHRLMGLRGVPISNRILVVGSGWQGALLSQPNLFKVNEAGTDGLLRQATLGNLYGFTVVADYTIDQYDAFAIHRDAVALVTRTSAVPRGVSFAATASDQGFTLRYLHDYDVDHLQDRAVVDIFAGAGVLDPQRIVRLTGKPGIEEPATTTPAAAAPSTTGQA